MIYRVRHATTYLYGETVALSHHQTRLCPRETGNQTLIRHQYAIEPGTPVTSRHTDYFGNEVMFFSLQSPHSKFVIEADSWVDVAPLRAPSTMLSPAWEEVRDAVTPELTEFVLASPMMRLSAEFRAYGEPTFTPGRPLLDAAFELSSRIHKEFQYLPKSTKVDTPPETALRERKGVCQDFAHVFLATVRSLGLPARYVSGYIPSGKDTQGAEASHAWVEVYCASAGWVGLDPTNNRWALDQHIVLAWGRDYSDVPPVKGVMLGGGDHLVQVAVAVHPDENPYQHGGVFLN
ncbi:transglutaminase [Bryobacterales bacterium F-183]|nr:transglutaminase [Bryobacterales bacterium F-183]